MPIDFPNPSISTSYTDPTTGNTYTFTNGSWSIANVLPATKGGTGFATYTRGDILFGNSSGTLSKLAAGTSGYVLSTNGSGADPTWIVQSGSGLTIASGTNGQIAFYSGSGSSIKGRSGFTVSDSDGTVDITTSDTTFAFNIKGGASVNKFRFDTDGSILHLNAGTGKSAELRLYTGDYSYYTGFKPYATASVTYILPSDKPSTGTSVLQSDSSGNMTWVAMTASSGGAGTVATPGSQYQIAGYYQGTGASVAGSSSFTNNTSSGIVSITHTTGSTSPSTGALLVSGGVGIAGTLSFYKSQLGVGGTTSIPSMSFIGNTNNPVYLNVLENNSLSFEGYHGQLLSISPDLTSGYIFTVGDISGIPLLRANANANITANEFGGNFGIGTTNPGSKLEVAGNVNITGTAVTLFSAVSNNYLYLNSGGNVIRIRTDAINTGVRFFETITTGYVSFFGTSGGTLYLGNNTDTQNGNITLRGTITSGGGGSQRAAIFTLATATSNGSGSGGTMIFQTSTSGNATASASNTLRTRLRIEGAATGTSNNESIIILGDTNAGTAWTSYLRGVDATGTDVEAGEIQIQAGRSTGTGNAQGISFYVSQSAAATSTVVNTASQIGRFTSTGLAVGATTSSTSTSTGALIVTGGVGVGGSLNVGALSKFSDHLEIRGSGPKELRLYETSGVFYIGLKAGSVSSSSKTFTLPTDYGTAGQFLYTTDTSGTLAWRSDPVEVSTGAVNQLAYYAAAGNTVSGSSTFTNDTSTGVVSIAHITASTGFSSGALVVTGGVGIGGSLRIGDTTNSTSTTTGSLTVRGGVGIAGTLYVGSGQAVTATATGDMVVTGGAGIGGSLRISGTTDATSNASGALIVSGGVGVAKNLYVGSQLSVSSTANLFGAVSFLNELSTATFQNRIIKSGSIALSLSGGGTSGAVVQVWNANIKETGIGTGSSVATIIPAISFKKQSFSATNASITYTKAANVYIEDAPDSSVTGATGSGGTNTVTILNSYALYVDQGKTFLGGSVHSGGNTFVKGGMGAGDIALDNNSLDTPGVMMYWANNKNFGLDTFGSTGATRVRFTRDLNETTGSELFSVDVNGVTYVNSGYGQPAPTFGVRAWVNFDGSGTSGTNQTIRGSGNVTSVYKNGTGDYTITFASAMPDANYCIQGMARTPGAADADVALNIKYNTTPAAGSFQITTARYGSALLDCAHIHVSVIR